MSLSFVNRIALGTTKLGMPYGAMQQTQVDENQTQKIFATAQKMGFNCFDTAPSYGTAENLIGQYLTPELRQSCITKVAKLASNEIHPIDLLAVDDSFQESLQNMQTSSCYGLLVHDVQDVLKPGAEKLVDWMYELKEKGRVHKIGVSVYTPEEVKEIYERFDFDLIQLPCNIFDQRFISSGMIERLAEQGVEIHARSLFLKGLLLKQPSDDMTIKNNVPPSLLKHHADFFQAMHQRDLTSYDACISFAKAQKMIDRWVVGVSAEKQLIQLSKVDENVLVNNDFTDWAFTDFDTLDPRNW